MMKHQNKNLSEGSEKDFKIYFYISTFYCLMVGEGKGDSKTFNKVQIICLTTKQIQRNIRPKGVFICLYKYFVLF